MKAWLLYVILTFGNPGEAPMAGVKIMTDLTFDTKEACEKALYNWKVSSPVIPVNGGGALCEPIKTT